ncbi:MAG: hypothetical protein P0S96_03065 [Simkaniaceae bacterium]|nr:hypothetical protein [Candidatus Sacchlamyda saccharinae]
MQNKIDYYLHRVFTPPFYHRQYEKDLAQDKTSESYLEIAKRSAHIALPFLSLYQPVGRALSLSMGSVRVLSSGAGIVSANSLQEGAQQVFQVGLATLALAGTLYNFTLGLYITTGADLTANLVKILERLYQLQYKEAGEELLQALSSGIYLAIMMTGSLEVVLASLLIQAFVSFVQAREEWSQGRIPEALAKTLMGMIRLYQGKQQMEIIERRNELQRQYATFVKRIQEGRKVDHLYNQPIVLGGEPQDMKGHPLEHLDAKMHGNRAILVDADGVEHDFGSHFYGYGKQKVKGMNIAFREEGGHTTLEFKVNHVFRDRLQGIIDDLSNASEKDLSDLLNMYGSHVEGISLQQTGEEWDQNAAYEVALKGLGKISIGASKDVINLYDRVTVQVDEGKNLYDFHEALSFLNLDDALKVSAQEDIDRMKIGHLFHMFAPKQATLFERTAPFFDLPLNQFKQEILKQSPEMAGVFDQWLSKMELRETLPGKMRWAVDGLADEIQKNGAKGLTAGVMGDWWWTEAGDESLYRRVGSMLKMGMLSHETRDRNDYGENGLGWGMDYLAGGADSVYTQMVTSENESFDEYAYQSPVRFTISPKALELGTYQYHSDSFGNRIFDPDHEDFFWFQDDYLKRNNILDFTTVERLNFSGENEVMFKDRIPPEYFTGIVVQDEETRLGLLAYLREKEIIQKDAQGRETILSRLADDFIHVGNTIKDQMFA